MRLLVSIFGGVFLMDNSIEKNNDSYQNILQGKLTNAFMMLSTKSFHVDTHSDSANAIVNNVKFSLGYINSIPHGFKFDTTVQRVFDVFILKLTRTLPYKKTMPDSDWKKYQCVSITLKEYMDLCQIKNRLRAVEQIKNTLNLINRIHVEFTDTRFISKKKSESIYYCFNIADNVGRKKGRGVYSIVFNIEFLKYLAQSYIMPFPLKLLQVNLKHYPHVYSLGRKLFLHKNMNYNKSNSEIISVKSLLESVSTLPTYDELKSTGKIKQRIIEPFEETFKFLVELNILSEWHYRSEKIDYYYEEFVNLYVIFRVKDYPTRQRKVDLTPSNKGYDNDNQVRRLRPKSDKLRPKNDMTAT